MPPTEAGRGGANLPDIQDVQRRQQVLERQAEEQPLRAAYDPIFRTQLLVGGPTRERIIAGLEAGGTPVRDERGMTVGVVRRGTGIFGGDDYVGRPDYNPIAARVNRMTGTGDQGPTFQERGGVIQAVGRAGAPVQTATGALRTRTGEPVRSFTAGDEAAPAAAPAAPQPTPGVVPIAPPRRTRAAPPPARGIGQRPAASIQPRTILGPASTTVSLLQ